MSAGQLIRLGPFHYIHVLDTNTNITRVEEGPLPFVPKAHENVSVGPEKMIQLPPQHYCRVKNPVVKDSEGSIVKDDNGMPKVRFGDEEIRTSEQYPDPFPLYPYEQMVGSIQKVVVVAIQSALKLKAVRDVEVEGQKRFAGEMWLKIGPCSYVPMVNVEIVEPIFAQVIKPNRALKIRAKKDMTDIYGNKRRAGEKWLIRETGAYLPQVDEEVMGEIKAIVLTDKLAVHLRAKRTFTDVYGEERKAGQEWLITNQQTEAHIPDVNEKIVQQVKAITLSNRQFCYVLDPVIKGKQNFGVKQLRKGELTFFLQPGENLERGIQNVFVLGEEEALLLRATTPLTDEKGQNKKAGDRWMIYGPCDYIPPVEVEVVESRKIILLGENEGIYVRDTKTGEVKSIVGKSYMLNPHEELWQMELSPDVEELLGKQITGESFQIAKPKEQPEQKRGAGKHQEVIQEVKKEYVRDKTKVVCFKAPHNSAVQVYNYKQKTSRVVFGPENVMLDPDEQFTVLYISGGKPKREKAIKSLSLMLGPDFMTDILEVETMDHARLSLTLSYSWYFKVEKSNTEDANKIFRVKDFVGDCCKTVASRIRGMCSQRSFDDFHKHSAELIQVAVFGKKEQMRNELVFESNNLVVTNVDVQEIEPVDSKTRESLQRSVNMAIEITTEMTKANAQHVANKQDQEQKGLLERQKILDFIEAEKSKKKLLQLQADSAGVASTGQAIAEAKAKAETQKIDGEAEVKNAQLKSEATKIEHEAELELIKTQQLAEVSHKKKLNELEINKAKELATIEIQKFKQQIEAVGKETIVAMAKAGPEFQAKLLKGLGLKGFMVMDGKHPVNLFNTAQGMVATGLPQ